METKDVNLVEVLKDLGYSPNIARPSASKIYKMAIITKELPMDCMISRKELDIIKKYVVEKSMSKFKEAWGKLDTNKVAAGTATSIEKSNVARINEVLLEFGKWAKAQKIDATALELMFATCKDELASPEPEKEEDED